MSRRRCVLIERLIRAKRHYCERNRLFGLLEERRDFNNFALLKIRNRCYFPTESNRIELQEGKAYRYLVAMFRSVIAINSEIPA